MNMTLFTDTQVLNPALYSSLCGGFKRVKITRQGQPMAYRIVSESIGSNRRWKINIQDWGESYRVCCPACGDGRFRLYVNHRHQTTEDTANIPFGSLLRCFNENCKIADFDDLYLKPYIARASSIKMGFSGEPDIELGEAPSPGRCYKLSSLPETSPVIQYLRNRKGGGFDPAYLEKQYNVCYCTEGTSEFGAMTGRLVIPIYYNGLLVGWQGRTIHDSDRMKYFTLPGFPKARVLYNFSAAEHRSFVVIVEGVTDVWRVGEYAIAPFGNTLSSVQKRMIRYTWGGRPIVIMLDPEEREKSEQFAKELRDADVFRGVANVILPGVDPGDMYPNDLWGEIYRQCTKQNVQLF